MGNYGHSKVLQSTGFRIQWQGKQLQRGGYRFNRRPGGNQYRQFLYKNPVFIEFHDLTSSSIDFTMSAAIIYHDPQRKAHMKKEIDCRKLDCPAPVRALPRHHGGSEPVRDQASRHSLRAHHCDSAWTGSPTTGHGQPGAKGRDERAVRDLSGRAGGDQCGHDDSTDTV